MQDTKKPTALIADDSLVNRRLLNEMLKRMGYDIIEASDGEQAVEAFKEHRPDIVFMDISMPVMDGFEATRIIKANSGGVFTPLFIVTALQENLALTEGVAAGADDFLTKPISMELLQAKIAAMQRIQELHRTLDEKNQVMETMHQQLQEEQLLAESIFNNAVYSENIDEERLTTKIIPASLFSGDTILSARKPDGGINVLLGDFTGHGLGAALGTIPVADSFRVMTEKGLSVKSIIAELNRKLERFLPANMFMACSFMSTHIDSPVVDVYNAGLPDLLLVNRKNQTVQHIASSELPLGIIPMEETSITLGAVVVNEDNYLLSYSDGLTESLSPGGEDYGPDRLDQAALAVKGSIIDGILDNWGEFCDGREPYDDVTLVAITE